MPKSHESRRRGWHRPVAIPPALDALHGPRNGSVQVPLRVYSSGSGPTRVFDLADDRERIELYEVVLTNGSLEDVCDLVNREELLRVWRQLWLPAHVRRAWEPLIGVAA